MSKLPNDCICLFYFQVGWGGGGVVWGWLYLINSLPKKKNTKNTDSHPAVLFNSFKFCAPVVFVWFWLFFSCLSMWEKWRHDRETCFCKNVGFFFFTFFCIWSVSLLISCLYLSYLTLNSCFVFVLLLLLILYLLILDLFIFALKSVNDI